MDAPAEPLQLQSGPKHFLLLVPVQVQGISRADALNADI